MDWTVAFDLFKTEARRVWRNADFVLPAVEFSCEEPAGEVLASLTYNPQGVWAIGNSLYRRAPHYTLRLSARLLVMDDDKIRRVLIHEAVHLGRPNHDAEFRRMVREHGGAVSESAVEGDGKIKLEAKIGARYRVIELVDSEEEARVRAQLYRQNNPGAKLRISL